MTVLDRLLEIERDIGRNEARGNINDALNFHKENRESLKSQIEKAIEENQQLKEEKNELINGRYGILELNEKISKCKQDSKTNQEIVDRLKKAYRKENNSEYGLVRKELIKSILGREK